MIDKIKNFLAGAFLESGEYPEYDELSLDDEMLYSDELDTMPDEDLPA